MQRRSFLKVIAGVLGAAAAPAISALPAAATHVVEATEPVAGASLGLIREFAAYDILRDELLIRYDVFCKERELQLCVDMRMYRGADLAMLREQAKDVLEISLKKRGLWWNDLTPLPLPDGYKPPDWLHA